MLRGVSSMSRYTTEVRYICEIESGLNQSKGANGVDDIVRTAAQKIFKNSYLIFDENYRPALEQKILKHYYTREIGFETVGLWMLKLRIKMNEIMPYYNQLYQSALMSFDPFKDTDITTEHKRNENGYTNDAGSNSSTANNESTGYNLFSNTPQGSLSGVESMTYLTDATKNTGNSTGVVNGSVNNHKDMSTTESYLESIKGKRGAANYSELLLKYRETFVNIDMKVINELSDLFLNLW